MSTDERYVPALSVGVRMGATPVLRPGWGQAPMSPGSVIAVALEDLLIGGDDTVVRPHAAALADSPVVREPPTRDDGA